MYTSVDVSVLPSKFVQTITSTIVDGFQNLTQLFSIMCRCTISNIHSGRSNVKVTWVQQGLGQPSSSLE